MDRLKELASQINQELLDHPLVKEYQELERAYVSNEYLKQLEKRIVAIQKQIVQTKSKKGSSQELIEEYNRIKDEYANHPLAANYMAARDELNDFLQELNKYMNNQLILDKVTDIA